MTRTSMIWSIGNDSYIVARIDSKYPKGNKDRYKEYIVDMKNLTCDCVGYWRYKKTCWHIKEVISQLRDKGGVINFQQDGDMDKLFSFAYRKGLFERGE